MSSTNPLVPIWTAYQVAEDTFKMSRRVVHFAERAAETLNVLDADESETKKAVAFAQYKAGKNFLNRIKVLNQTDTLNSLLTQSAQEISDLFVLSLWATFERFVKYFLQEKGKKIREILPLDLGKFYYQQLYQEIDYWKSDDILDLLKYSLFKGDEQQIGQAKEVLKYRDWIAHGKNPNKMPSSTITPKLAYDRLHDIIEILIVNQ
ncbi:hypothetical protein PN36_24670 [Candidatus Thiomargarita nelsonii]|uniref:RiboL-PSP-HEPN domain-containing protein n=1 Tax=Candidatus Thiomargarita nelsonii TaxID=1003181 RepID=A0A0A6PGQ1_9GAMM|nr:hypothetical protein PN36_24670 [Candidatus Thiomargarita nelsonii]